MQKALYKRNKAGLYWFDFMSVKDMKKICNRKIRKENKKSLDKWKDM